MNSTGTLRLFLSIPIPETVRAALRRAQLELQLLLPLGAVRWTRPEQFHLTLKFLGNVPAKDTDALVEAARAVCASAPPMRLRACGTGFFPDDSSPRVFWADIKSMDDLLMGFQRQLDMAVQRFAEKQDGQRFTAHITLARFDKMGASDLEKIKLRVPIAETFGEWTVREVELIQSTLSPSGSSYAILTGFKTKMTRP